MRRIVSAFAALSSAFVWVWTSSAFAEPWHDPPDGPNRVIALSFNGPDTPRRDEFEFCGKANAYVAGVRLRRGGGGLLAHAGVFCIVAHGPDAAWRGQPAFEPLGGTSLAPLPVAPAAFTHDYLCPRDTYVVGFDAVAKTVAYDHGRPVLSARAPWVIAADIRPICGHPAKAPPKATGFARVPFPYLPGDYTARGSPTCEVAEDAVKGLKLAKGGATENGPASVLIAMICWPFEAAPLLAVRIPVTPTGPLLRSTQEFAPPLGARGIPIDACLRAGEDASCGQPAADAFCKARGFARAAAFAPPAAPFHTVQQTVRVSGETACEGGYCWTFTSITCTR